MVSSVLTSGATCEETGTGAIDAAEAGVGPEGENTPRPEGRAPEGTVGGGKDAESMSAVGAGGMCEA